MDVRREKILFILPALHGGGAERVMLTLVKHIDRKKFLPIFVLLKKEGKFIKQVPRDIEMIDLKATQARYAIFKIAKIIREKKPDIVFSTLGHLNLLMALIRPFFSKKIKFISRESNTVSVENKGEKYPRLFDFLYKKIYNNFDLIITQSEYMKKDLVENYKTDQSKAVVIYNPVDIEHIEERLKEQNKTFFDSGKINLLAVGRLSHQKGFDILINTMTLLNDKYHLTILGEGEDKESLNNQIKILKMENKITLAGFTNNPYTYMLHCDLFILSSRYEGLPNVVLETNSCGTPVVAVNSPGGTAEIVKNGVNGILTPSLDPQQLANDIKKATKYRFNSYEIKEYIRKNFNVRKIVKEYERVVNYL